MALAARTQASQVATGKSFAARRAGPVSTRRVPLRVRAGEVATEAPVGVEKSVPALKAVLDIEAIKEILPHR